MHRSYAFGNTDAPCGVVVDMEISEALEFAADHRNGVLATQKRDGRPQLSNITYAVIDGVIKISVTAGRAKYANLLRTPQASLHVTRDDFWAYVVIDGDVEMSEVAIKPDDPGVEELVEYYRTLAGEHPDWDDYRKVMVADKRVIVRLTPTHAYGCCGAESLGQCPAAKVIGMCAGPKMPTPSGFHVMSPSIASFGMRWASSGSASCSSARASAAPRQ